MTRLHSLPRKHPSLKRPSHQPADGGDAPPSPLLRSNTSLSNAHSDSNIGSRKRLVPIRCHIPSFPGYRSGLIWDSRDITESPLPSHPLGYKGDSSSSLSSCTERSSVSSLTESLRSQPLYTTPNRIPTPHVTGVSPRVISLDRNTRYAIYSNTVIRTQVCYL